MAKRKNTDNQSTQNNKRTRSQSKGIVVSKPPINDTGITKENKPNLSKHKNPPSKAFVKRNRKTKRTSRNKKTKTKTRKELHKEPELPQQDNTPQTILNAEIQIQDESNQESLLCKNGAVIDSYIPNAAQYHVIPAKPSEYKQPFFSCYLQYSNLKYNNNKFYIIQLLEHDITKDVFIFFRWGRTGKKGQTTFSECKSLEHGKQFYQEKYEAKTAYGYKEIQLNYENTSQNNNTNNDSDYKSKPCTLGNNIKELISLLYDINLMDDQMKQIGYDSTQLPLGRLSNETINEGNEILKKIEILLHSSDKNIRGKIMELSSEFYTKIPHDFGFTHIGAFTIDTSEKIQEKIELLESLRNIGVVTKVITDNNNNNDEHKESKEESYYNNLNCTITVLPEDSAVYKQINKYLVISTQLPSSPQFELLTLYELVKPELCEKNEAEEINKMLLWYGTRTANYVSIIKDGFQLPSPDAPTQSFAFGKGIYFSDMSNKAIATCYPNNNIGLLLWCEVNLGMVDERTKTDNNLPHTIQEGKDSIKVLGINAPDKTEEIVENGVIIPMGKPIRAQQIQTFHGFNRYVVYDPKRIRIRYLLKIKISQ